MSTKRNPSFSKNVPDEIDSDGNGVFATYDGTIKAMRLAPGWTCNTTVCHETHTGICGDGKLIIYGGGQTDDPIVERVENINRGDVFTVAGSHLLCNRSRLQCNVVMFSQGAASCHLRLRRCVSEREQLNVVGRYSGLLWRHRRHRTSIFF